MDFKWKNRFTERVVEISLGCDAELASADLAKLEKEWKANLFKWHSPYIVLFETGSCTLAPGTAAEWARMLRFFRGFHMQKFAMVADVSQEFANAAGWDLFAKSREEALSQLGLKWLDTPDEDSLPTLIRMESFYEEQFIEISFAARASFQTAEDVGLLKIKLEGLLRQWHTAYAVVFDATHFVLGEQALPEFERLLAFLKSFFCRTVVGYGAPKGSALPFLKYKTRHEALEEVKLNAKGGKSSTECSRQDVLLGRVPN